MPGSLYCYFRALVHYQYVPVSLQGERKTFRLRWSVKASYCRLKCEAFIQESSMCVVIQSKRFMKGDFFNDKQGTEIGEIT